MDSLPSLSRRDGIRDGHIRGLHLTPMIPAEIARVTPPSPLCPDLGEENLTSGTSAATLPDRRCN